MRITTLIFLIFSNVTFSQTTKVRLEGEENNITEEVNNLEYRIEALEVAKREFNSAEKFMDEYYDLYYKALSSGDANIANSAIEKLKRANELLCYLDLENKITLFLHQFILFLVNILVKY